MTTIKFGTDGWRAIIAEDYTFDNVRICAQAVARYVQDARVADRGVVIGYDRNVSPRLFVNAFNDYESDRFQGLDLRFVLGGGFGFHAMKGERAVLVLSALIPLVVGMLWTDRIPRPFCDEGFWTWALIYRQKTGSWLFEPGFPHLFLSPEARSSVRMRHTPRISILIDGSRRTHEGDRLRDIRVSGCAGAARCRETGRCR